MSKEKFSVTLMWGGATEVIKYDFDSEEELDAFMHGVDQSTGWLSYEEVDTNQNYEIVDGELRYEEDK